jgi:hypothetical protein
MWLAWERSAFGVLAGKYEVMIPLGRARHRWEYNNKVDLIEIG